MLYPVDNDYREVRNPDGNYDKKLVKIYQGK